jgi:hypothetical protein
VKPRATPRRRGRHQQDPITRGHPAGVPDLRGQPHMTLRGHPRPNHTSRRPSGNLGAGLIFGVGADSDHSPVTGDCQPGTGRPPQRPQYHPVRDPAMAVQRAHSVHRGTRARGRNLSQRQRATRPHPATPSRRPLRARPLTQPSTTATRNQQRDRRRPSCDWLRPERCGGSATPPDVLIAGAITATTPANAAGSRIAQRDRTRSATGTLDVADVLRSRVGKWLSSRTGLTT